jgi:hypothetical protein
MPATAEETAGSIHSGKSSASVIADLLAVVVLISVCLFIALPRWRCGIDWGDEGFLAYGAVRVMEGQIPNRDFVSLQPPLSFYVAGAMFKLFGCSLGSLRILGLAIYILIPLIVYGIARTAAKPATAAVTALSATVLGIPYFYFVPSAVWQGIAVSLMAAYLYLLAILRRSPTLAFPAGLMMAASILLRHDQGLYLLLSILVFSLAAHYAQDERFANVWTSLRFMASGISTVILPAGIYWTFQGALPEMFRQLIVFPLTTYPKTSLLPFHGFTFALPFSRNGVVALYYLPPLLVLVAAAWLIRRILRREFYSREAILTFFIVWAGLFYLQVLTRSDIFHLFITLPPFFILLAASWSIFTANLDEAVVKRGFSRSSSGSRILVSLFATAGLIWFLWAISPVCLPSLTNAKEVLALDRGGVRVQNAATIEQVVRAVQKCTSPDRSILCLPYQPIFYFLCERRNPTHWDYLWPGDQTENDHTVLVQQAKRDPPAAVLILKERKMASYAPTIVDYVHREYQHVADSGELALYLPQ